MRRAALVLLALAAWPAWAGQAPSVTLAYGLEEIHERALRPLSVETLATAGLKGLDTLDPAIDVAYGRRRVRIGYEGRALAGYPRPAAADAVGWARLLDRAARRARGVSALIARADDEEVTQAFFDAMLTRLDVFSHYSGPAEARERDASRSGFGGVGVRFVPAEGGVRLTEVIPDSPAAQARLEVGDLLTAIDGERTAGLDQELVSEKLRGPVLSAVRLRLQRTGAPPMAVTLRRSLIVLPTVSAAVADGIGVIAISGFNDNTAASVAEAVRKAEAAPGFKGIVLDLRGNPGGRLDQGVAVADLFIAHGRILTTRGRHPDSLQVYDAKPGDSGEHAPLVALVDGRTASAAEIVAGALQDSGRAVLVGTNSFGKGTVQTVLPLPNGGELALTWSRFYVPSGYALHELGVLPAICTAGGGAHGDRMLAGGRAAPPSLFALWRATPPDDDARRVRLRSHCRAEDHSRDEADLSIARRLLEDPALYARALAVAAPVATASAQRTPATPDRRRGKVD